MQILLIIIIPFLKSLSWPTYPVSRLISSFRTHSIDRVSFSESAMAVGTGFGQLFRSVGQVRSTTLVAKCNVQATTWCRLVAWPSLRRFSSLFSIGNSETESTGLDQTRYPKIKISTFISPSSPQIITRIRQSAKLVVSLPPDLQRHARDSYDVALRIVFIMGMCSTLMAYIARLPVSFIIPVGMLCLIRHKDPG